MSLSALLRSEQPGLRPKEANPGLSEGQVNVSREEAGTNEETQTSELNEASSGFSEQVENIRFSSHEALAARNEARISEISQIELNRLDGACREEFVGEELLRDYPPEDGYHIEAEVYLRNADGSIARDPLSEGSGVLEGARRLDFVVIKDGAIQKSVEVTSETAPKQLQIEKEERIRESGGDFVLNRSTN